MKRGNTALKRVVSVASVAAMAIAGAVLAAPAASAAPADAPATVRATPIADAAFMTNDGVKVSSSISDARVYGTTSADASTGQVPTIPTGSTNQLLSGFQVELDTAVATDAFAKDDVMSFELPAGIEFASAPIVSMTRQPIVKADILKKANPTALAIATGATNAATPSRAVDKNVLNITFNEDDPNGAVNVATGAYLITVSNVRVNVTKDYTGGASAITVDGRTAAGVANGAATTLGYISTFTVSTAGTYPANAKDVALPAVSVTELTAGAFAEDGATFDLQVSADKAGSDPIAVDASGAKLTASSSVKLADATVAATDDTVTVDLVSAGTTDTTKLERVTVSGLKVTGVKAGADVTVTLVPAIPATNDSGISATADQQDSAAPHATVASAVVLPRLAGASRYETASDIALQFADTAAFKGSAVVIANGTTVKNGADALSANFLAYAKGAPILLTDGATLSADTKDALTSLFKGSQTNVTIYAMGKEDSVSTAVLDAAKAAVVATVDTGAVTTERVAGDDRYETAAASASAAGASALGAYDLGEGLGYTAFLASGEVNADALAAGAISAKAGVPVLLTTDGDALPAATSKFIKDSDVTNVVILGANDRVSDKAETSLKDAGVHVTRVAGTDRYDTAVEVNKVAYKNFATALVLSDATAYLANGTAGFPDALAVGPLAGANQNPLLTVPQASLPTTTQTWLAGNKANIGSVVALGQSDRIADSVITAAQLAIK